MRASVDTGGTFTDLVLEHDDGRFSLHKAPTTPDDPPTGIIDAIDIAAFELGLSRTGLLSQLTTLSHATTHPLNALLTGRTSRTGLFVTEGHRDILLLREGGREHFNSREAFPRPLVPRELTFEVAERVVRGGRVEMPLDVDRAADAVRRALELGIEAAAVVFLWSTVNAEHELQMSEIIRAAAPDLPQTLSHQLSASLREYRRASASCIDASLKPMMRRYLTRLEAVLVENAFAGRLLIVTSNGGLLDLSEVIDAPIHTIRSGPAMAPVAGLKVAMSEIGGDSVVVTDTGGTSYDVTGVNSGLIPLSRETWLGKPFHSPLIGFPAVDVQSSGAGGGSVAWVDSGGLLRLGPMSAGADPGPMCYGRGGEVPTLTDACLTLGYLEPDRFLGGRLRLDAQLARDGVNEHVAIPLGVELEVGAAAVVDLATAHMARAIEDCCIRNGLALENTILVAGGGAAGLNAASVAQRVGIRWTVIPSIAPVLSAAGALISPVMKDIATSQPHRISTLSTEDIADIFGSLLDRARQFLGEVTSPDMLSGIDLFAEGHYLREVWDIDVALGPCELGLPTADRISELFHARHEQLYSTKHTGSEIEIVTWRARAWCQREHIELPVIFAKPRDSTSRRITRVFFAEAGWLDCTAYDYDEIAPHEDIVGPVIVSSDATTIVVPPGCKIQKTAQGGVIIDGGTVER